MAQAPPFHATEGSPEPLGVSLCAEGINIAVHSSDAEAIEFCLFDSDGGAEIARLALPGRTGPVFHGHIRGVGEGARYGLRAHGPFAPERGQRFNANKLLIDPFAAQIDRPFVLGPSLFAYRVGDPAGAVSFDDSDSAAAMPKAVVTAPPPPVLREALSIPWAETVIYELHVRGFTRLHPDIPEPLRGTFAGLAHPAAIAHLKRLGVTAVELMPACAWIDERHLGPLGLSNYWGYNPAAFLAPDPRLAPGGWAEVRTATDALAAAGIECLLDVVFNHTGEGDALGPTLSLRGLDNAGYYRLNPNAPQNYVDDSGTGNTLALDRPAGVRLAMDALRAWRRWGGVDGFRFDLATVLGRRPEGFDPAAPLLSAIAQDPDLRGLKLIAEPWDCGPGGYQLGRFPAGWGEWNDRFRDTIRGFWRGDGVSLGELARRLAGSEDLLPGRRPSRSVNFVVAHDGFTLADLVAFDAKHNLANGEEGRDGTNDNRSWNNGVEGASDDPAITAARRNDQRALLATLMLARGAPMLSMGAELGHSQGGNNNAYAQDNATSWLDWSKADAELMAFTARLAQIRRAHPALRADCFLTGLAQDGGYLDVVWRKADGGALQTHDWDEPTGQTLVMSLNEPADAGLDRVVVALHRGAEPVQVTPPQPRDGFGWTVLADTADDARQGLIEDAGLTLARRSVVVLAETPTPGRPSRGVDDAVLARLAEAAGIASEWWTVQGAHHQVSPQTRRALLAAMRLPAETTDEAQASLHRLAEDHDRRPLPYMVAGRLDRPIEVRLAYAPGAPAPYTWLSIEGENGQVRRLRITPQSAALVTFLGRDGRPGQGLTATLPPLPAGRYRLIRDDHPGSVCRLTIAPATCYAPRDHDGFGLNQSEIIVRDRFKSLERDAGGKPLRTFPHPAPGVQARHRRFGLTAQIYSVRRRGDQGVGDFTTLGALGETAAAQGAALLGVNPLHTLFHDPRGRASPYYPSDRRFLEPIYLDLAKVAFAGDIPARAGDLSSLPLIDYPKVWALKAAMLETSFLQARDDPRLDAFIADGGETLRLFAIFQAVSETRLGSDWRDWPAQLRDVTAGGAQAFAATHGDRVRFHQYLQWLCEDQLAGAAGRASGLELGLCRDLAVGAAPDGAEAWAEGHLSAEAISIGAPPDLLGPHGQVWGLPPLDPHRLIADGCRSMANLFAANMRHAGALRIDHVMGLARLFWVPQGADGSQGAYVAYPLNPLLAELALESQRARCLIIGEDLGTVPAGLREILGRDEILSYRVLPFERDGARYRPPADYPVLAFACAATHDLPPLAGWWDGLDIQERLELALFSPGDAEAARAGLLADKQALIEALIEAGLLERNDVDPSGPLTSALAAAIHGFIAKTPSVLAIAQVEDLAGERIAVNLPGTDRERPNWRRRIAPSLDQLLDNPPAQSILAALRNQRD